MNPKPTPVPRLDLAPKLNRPLSLLNPLDYLRLLYWVFYFPQALRWYVEKYANTKEIPRQLNIQVFALIVVTPLLLCGLLQQIGFSIDWLGVLIGLLFSVLLVMICSTVYLSGFENVPAFFSFLMVSVLIVLGLGLSISLGLGLGLGRNMASGWVFGWALGQSVGLAIWVAFGFWVYSLDRGLVVKLRREHINFAALVGKFSDATISFINSSDLPTRQNILITKLKSACLRLEPLMVGVLILLCGLVRSFLFAIVGGLAVGFMGYIFSEENLYNSLGLMSAQENLLFGLGLVCFAGMGLGWAFSWWMFNPSMFSWWKFDLIIGLLGGVALGVSGTMVLGVWGGTAGIWAGAIALWRPEHWLFSLFFSLRKQWHRSWQFAHIAPIPVPGLTSQIKNWLRQDWQTGVQNINQVLAYTLQFIPAIAAVNQVLAETPPDQIIWRVAQLAENPYDWHLIYFASSADFWINIPETDSRLVAAGFWYLHQNEPANAAAAFEKVRHLQYGEEMYYLAQILADFSKQTDPRKMDLIPPISVSGLPPIKNRLRPITWRAMNGLYNVYQLIDRHNDSSFPFNSVIAKLQLILDFPKKLPKAERQLIINIAQTWHRSLVNIRETFDRRISAGKALRNPYIIGNPVEGNEFVGREDILRQLEELWVRGNRLQSVVLFGHRRMGKTSILKNVNSYLGSGVQLAYVNLLDVAGAPEGVGEVLMAICDEIAETVKLSPPADEDLVKLPYPTFKRYLKQVEKQLEVPQTSYPPITLPTPSQPTPNPSQEGNFEGNQRGIKRGLREVEGDGEGQGGKGLIIALDEFEVIENLINAGKINPDFMGMLRSRVQATPKIAFAFAGLHTLEEMTEDYFQPFFASIIPIRVGFLSRSATEKLLVKPKDDFDIYYQPETLNFIYYLTCGQPFLLQLIGFQLVRDFNHQVFEQRKSRHLSFEIADVEAAINDPEFYQLGRYYFTGVWGQAEQDVPGQQNILQALAPHEPGLPVESLAKIVEMDPANLSAAIETLKRHDVVAEKDGHLRIIVELFRRWVTLETGGLA